jgi:hypothetical protein
MSLFNGQENKRGRVIVATGDCKRWSSRPPGPDYGWVGGSWAWVNGR